MIKRFDVVPIFIGAYDETYNGVQEKYRDNGKCVAYSDHAFEMREVLSLLADSKTSEVSNEHIVAVLNILDKYAHYLEEK